MQNIKKLSIYDVNPRYFKDKTGNGIGDFEGMAQKFDYFDYLGVDAIILQDVLASHTDEERPKYTSVNKEVGDINGLQLVLSHAKKYGIKIFLEMKIGTITDKHAWFQNAIDNIEDRGENIVEFAAKKEEVGTEEVKYNKEAKAYFAYDERTKEIPLNWKSDEVIDKFIEVVKFWNNLGISGFVFRDFEFIGDKTKTVPMNEATLKDLRKFYRAIKEVNDDIVVIGKSQVIELKEADTFTSGSTQVFDYFQSTRISRIGTYNKHGADAPGTFHVRNLVSRMDTFAHNPANILSFGSETIGRFISRWGDDKQYHKESAKAFALLNILTPASSSTYYADELGAKNIGLTHLDDFQDKTLEERKIKMADMKVSEKEFMDAQVLQNPINARSLMMWNDKKNGGFGLAQQTITPVSNEYAESNVEVQFADENSILNFYKELNRIIHKSTYAPIIAKGNWKIANKITSPGVVKMTSVHDNKEVIVMVNLTDSDRKIFGMPKEGRVVLSTYTDKEYPELPTRLQAFEGIIISKHTDEYIKETQMVKMKETKEAAKAKLEKLKAEEKERLAKERAEIERTQELQAKKEAAAAKRAATIAAKKAAKLAEEEEKANKEAAKNATAKKVLGPDEMDTDAERAAIEAAKQKAKEEREAEKTRQIEMKQAEKEAKRLAKEEAKAERQAEKTRMIELKQAAKEEAAREKAAEQIDATETVVKKDVKTNNDTNTQTDDELIQEMNDLFADAPEEEIIEEKPLTDKEIAKQEAEAAKAEEAERKAREEAKEAERKAKEEQKEADRKAREEEKEARRIEKEKAREAREAEKTKMFEIKIAEKEAKRKAKEEAKAEKEAEKTRMIEVRQAEKEAAAKAREAEKAAQAAAEAEAKRLAEEEAARLTKEEAKEAERKAKEEAKEAERAAKEAERQAAAEAKEAERQARESERLAAEAERTRQMEMKAAEEQAAKEVELAAKEAAERAAKEAADEEAEARRAAQAELDAQAQRENAKKAEMEAEENRIAAELRSKEDEAQRIAAEKAAEEARISEEQEKAAKEAEKTRTLQMKLNAKEERRRMKAEAKAERRKAKEMEKHEKDLEKTRMIELRIKEREAEARAAEAAAAKASAEAEALAKSEAAKAVALAAAKEQFLANQRAEEQASIDKAEEERIIAENKALEEEAKRLKAKQERYETQEIDKDAEQDKLERERAEALAREEETKELKAKLAKANEKELNRRMIEINKEKEKAAKLAEKTRLMDLKESARIEREAAQAASLMNDEVKSSDMTTLKESDIAPTTQIDVDDIDDIEEFLKNSK